MTRHLAFLALLRDFCRSRECARYLDRKHPGRRHALSAYARRTEAERLRTDEEEAKATRSAQQRGAGEAKQ